MAEHSSVKAVYKHDHVFFRKIFQKYPVLEIVTKFLKKKEKRIGHNS
jgi:hypothetical protein